MAKIAIDVALLTPGDVTRNAVQINRALLTGKPDELVLNERDIKPHVTLTLGIIDDASLPAVQNALDRIAATHEPVELTVNRMHHSPRQKAFDFRVMSDWRIDKTEALVSLHHAVTKALAPFWVDSQPDAALFEKPEEINAGTLDYPISFPKSRNPATWSPHLTLGVGKAPMAGVPFSFKATRLAACRLGNFCTCRTVLAQSRLGD